MQFGMLVGCRRMSEAKDAHQTELSIRNGIVGIRQRPHRACRSLRTLENSPRCNCVISTMSVRIRKSQRRC